MPKLIDKPITLQNKDAANNHVLITVEDSHSSSSHYDCNHGPLFYFPRSWVLPSKTQERKRGANDSGLILHRLLTDTYGVLGVHHQHILWKHAYTTLDIGVKGIRLAQTSQHSNNLQRLPSGDLQDIQPNLTNTYTNNWSVSTITYFMKVTSYNLLHHSIESAATSLFTNNKYVNKTLTKTQISNRRMP